MMENFKDIILTMNHYHLMPSNSGKCIFFPIIAPEGIPQPCFLEITETDTNKFKISDNASWCDLLRMEFIDADKAPYEKYEHQVKNLAKKYKYVELEYNKIDPAVFSIITPDFLEDEFVNVCQELYSFCNQAYQFLGV